MLLRTRSMFPIAALGVILGAVPSGSLMSQASLDGAGQRRAAESFLSALSVPTDGSRAGATGIGVRLLWDAANLVQFEPSFAGRAEVGLYGSYIPIQNLSGADAFTAYRLGVIGDMRVVETPLAGMIDPVLSLGMGVWHSSATGMRAARSPLLSAPVTAFELAPGAGLRFPFGPSAAMLFDVHDAMIVGNATRQSLALDVGLRFGF